MIDDSVENALKCVTADPPVPVLLFGDYMWNQRVGRYSDITKETSFEDKLAREGGAPVLPRPTVEELKHGVAELRIKQEDARGSAIENGTVPLTPPQNALAPHNSA